MNKNEYYKKLFKTGEVSVDENVMFLLEYFFSIGLTLEDYKKELYERLEEHNRESIDSNDSYVEMMIESSLKDMKIYINKHAKSCMTWQEEIDNNQGRK